MSDVTLEVEGSDIVTINGIRYSGELFESCSVFGVGQILEIVSVDDGLLTVRHFPDLERFLKQEREAAILQNMSWDHGQ